MSKENISPEDVVSNAHKGVYSVSYAPSLLDGSYSSPSTPLPEQGGDETSIGGSMTHQLEVTRIWDEIRQILRDSAMSRMTIPQANEFQICTTPLLGPKIRELIDREIINELKTFTGISSEIPESEILARIKELEKTL